MGRNLQVALTLLAKDTASKVLRQSMQDNIKQIKLAEKASDALAKSQQQSANSGIKASRSLQDEYRRAASARATLDIRSEREIQREIMLTQAAYNRLTRSGLLSAQEQSRAFSAMTSRVTQLRNELNGASQSMSRFERAKNMGSNLMAAAGGVTAAAMVISDPVKRQMAFEMRNAEMANTAYNELTPEERVKKIPIINEAVQNAVRHGGGTPEQAQSTLNTLFASGQVSNETAMKILPDIMRYSTASGANPDELAKIASAAIANFGIKAEELPLVFDKAIRSGENGKFELADMAQKMPGTMTLANSLGMSGLNDLDKLFAMYQANALTSADNSSAATQVDQFLGKVTSADTQNAMKNYMFRTKDGKTLGYTDYMAQQRLEGVSTPDAFINAVSGIVSGDSRVKKLRAEAKKYKGTDKEKDILAALDVVISSITSKIIADKEAGMGLKTLMLKKDYVNEQIKGTKNASGAGAASYGVISSTNAFKSQQLEAEKLFAEQDAMKPLADLYGDLATKLTEYANKYPELTTLLSGASTGIKAMTAAAVAFGGIKFLSGMSGGVAAADGIKAPAATALKESIGKGGRLFGRLLAPIAVYQGMQDAPLVKVERGDAGALERLKANKYSDDAQRMKDVLTSRPGFLDAVDEVKAWWSSPSTIGASNGTPQVSSYLLPPQPVTDNKPLNITTRLELDGRVLAETVNEYNGNTAIRGHQGN
ncbi:phage tail tape measure protein [Shigella sonnei]|nr:phage tail tape measure protein [Escherichia coli]EFW5532225.1 phage tail tape measure protein [Shigella sonnei]EGA6848529.1 phage tail tape measure protein [Shigella sonnei]EKC9672238.1 phage tail tape measure protein [Escherichia coli]